MVAGFFSVAARFLMSRGAAIASTIYYLFCSMENLLAAEAIVQQVLIGKLLIGENRSLQS